jgi:predicted DNA-binding transcriptional regulator AlpA
MLKLPDDKILLTRDDLKKLGIVKSNVTLLRYEAAQRFPRRVRLNGCSVAWRVDEVAAWLNKISEARATHVYAELR